MGNNNSPQQGFYDRLVGWEVVPGPSDRLLYRNISTGEQIEGYRFLINDVTELGREREAYSMRLDSTTLVASRHLIEDDEKDLCSTYYKGELFLELIPYRLSEIDEIPYPDILHLYSQCFKGFGELFAFAGYFDITQDLICINRQGEAKVWLNPSLQKTRPQVSYGALSTESQMVNRVIAIIDKNTNHLTLPENIGATFLQSNLVSFAAAQKALLQIAIRYRLSIPSKIKSAEQLMNRTNPVIPITTHQPINSSIQSKLQYQPIIVQQIPQQITQQIHHPAVSPSTTTRIPEQHFVTSVLPSVNESINFSKNTTSFPSKGPITLPQPYSQFNFTQKHAAPIHLPPQPSYSPQLILPHHKQADYRNSSPVQPLYTVSINQFGSSRNQNIQSPSIISSPPQTIPAISKFTSNPVVSPFQFKHQNNKIKRQTHDFGQLVMSKDHVEQIVGSTNNRVINRLNQQNPIKNFSIEKPRAIQNKTISQFVNNQHLHFKPSHQKQNNREHHANHNHQYKPNITLIKQGPDSKINRRTISLEHHSNIEPNKTDVRTQTKATQFFKQKTLPNSKQPVNKTIIHPQSFTSPLKPNIQHTRINRDSQTPTGQIRPLVQKNQIGIKTFQLDPEIRLSTTPINRVMKTPSNINTLSSNKYFHSAEKPKLEINSDDIEGCTSPELLAMIRTGGDSSKSATKNISSFSNEKKIYVQEEVNSSNLQFGISKQIKKHEIVQIFAPEQSQKLQNPYVTKQPVRSPITQNGTASFEHYSASKFRQDVNEIEKKIDSLNEENVLLEKDIIEILTKQGTN